MRLMKEILSLRKETVVNNNCISAKEHASLVELSTKTIQAKDVSLETKRFHREIWYFFIGNKSLMINVGEDQSKMSKYLRTFATVTFVISTASPDDCACDVFVYRLFHFVYHYKKLIGQLKYTKREKMTHRQLYHMKFYWRWRVFHFPSFPLQRVVCLKR